MAVGIPLLTSELLRSTWLMWEFSKNPCETLEKYTVYYKNLWSFCQHLYEHLIIQEGTMIDHNYGSSLGPFLYLAENTWTINIHNNECWHNILFIVHSI